MNHYRKKTAEGAAKMLMVVFGVVLVISAIIGAWHLIFVILLGVAVLVAFGFVAGLILKALNLNDD